LITYRGWIELKPSLTAAVSHGGRLRVIVRRDVRQNSPEAVEELYHLPYTQIAFGLEDTAFHSKDYLFGKRLTVLTSSASATYAGLMQNDEGGAIIKHAEISTDEAAQKAIAIFERRWRNATLVDEKVLAAFKTDAVPPHLPRAIVSAARTTFTRNTVLDASRRRAEHRRRWSSIHRCSCRRRIARDTRRALREPVSLRYRTSLSHG
jgi:PLD-like domain